MSTKKVRQLLAAVLSIVMILSLIVVPAGAVELRTKWDYRNWDKDYTWGADEKVTVQGEKKTVSGLEIDATASGAKYDASNAGSSWVQVNAGTIIKIPVNVPANNVAVLTAEFYGDGQFYVDGALNTKGSGKKDAETFTCAGTDGYITLEAKVQGYIGYLSVSYQEGQIKPTLTLDKDSVVVKVGETVEVTPTLQHATLDTAGYTLTPLATPTTDLPGAATATVNNGKFVIEGTTAGKTTVTVHAALTDSATVADKTINVRVLPTEVGQVTENKLYTFQLSNDDKVTGYDNYYAPGLVWTNLPHGGNDHGPQGTGSLQVVIPDGKQTTLELTLCCYGDVSKPNVTNGTVDEGADTTEEKKSGETHVQWGKKYTITEAKGTVIIGLGGNGYVHSLQVGAFETAQGEVVQPIEEKSWNFAAIVGKVQNDPITGNDLANPGLTLNNVKFHSTGYGSTSSAGATIGIPVEGPCNIVVEVGYEWNLHLGDDTTFGEKSTKNENKPITFYYKGEEGTATLTMDGTSYIKTITLAQPSDPAPALRVKDADATVALKKGETETATVPVYLRAATVDDLVITPADATVATATAATSDTGATLTVTAGNVTETKTTTIEVKLNGKDDQAADIRVTVDPEGEVDMTLAEGEFNFSAGGKGSEAIRGITWEGFTHEGNSHGVQAVGVSKIKLNLKGSADITVTTCRYGVGTKLSMTSTSGEVKPQGTWNESGANGATFTVVGATGETTLEFTPDPVTGEIYIHTLSVKYDAVQEGPRKIDVWDMAGKTETGENYVNNITPALWVSSGKVADGKIKADGNITFSDLTMNCKGDDRIYSAVDGGADFTAILGSYTTGFENDYADGYKALGGWYCNGTGGADRRYVIIDRVQQGDKIVAYMGSTQNSDIPFHFDGQGAAVGQADVATVAVNSYDKVEFVAESKGSYKIWADTAGGGKPLYHRFVRVPGVAVTGTLQLPQGFDVQDYGLKFRNTTTQQETVATLDGTNFTVTLAPGFTYTAQMTGTVNWGFTAASKSVTTTDAESLTGKTGVALVVEQKFPYKYSGSVTGFADGYDLTDLTVTLVPEAGKDAEEVVLDLQADKSFTAYLVKGVNYTIELSGVNDYSVKTPATIVSEADKTENIVVELKGMHTAKGKFLGLGEDGAVTALSFVNKDDGYEYPATLTADGYTVSLRDGTYSSKATITGKYSTITHVVMNGADVEKDLLFVSTAAKPAVDWVADVYVGYPAKANNYDTVTAAVDAVSRMGVGNEDKRVTVHIAPGTYREQITVNTDYVTFINDEPEKGEVLLTWYYGIGYVYYSAGEPGKGYYDPQRAYDKVEKNIADRWGTAVRVLGNAFRAENITFENSFNRYVTDEEIADGVELGGGGSDSATLTERTKGMDVTTKGATERAAAICVEGNQCEFYKCTFLSSQDTVYTDGKVYFKDCLIEGQTDYIFGDFKSRCVFDNCELSWKGYSTGTQGGYLTALRTNPGVTGYLFRNCTVTEGELPVTPGYWGRPWAAGANVKFINTKLEKADLIVPVGWTDMSGNKPENAQFGEFGTTALDGADVDTSERTQGTVLTRAQAEAIQMADYFGTWIPYYYEDHVAPVAKISLADGETAAEESYVMIVGDTKDLNVLVDPIDAEQDFTVSEGTDAVTVTKGDGKITITAAAVTEEPVVITVTSVGKTAADKTATATVSITVSTAVEALDAAIAAAKAAVNEVEISDDGTDVYEGDMWTNQTERTKVEDAIKAAQDVAADPETDDAVAKQAIETLKTAMDAFKRAQAEGTRRRSSSAAVGTGTKPTTTVTETSTNDKGDVATTVTKPDGDKTITVVNADGETVAEVKLPASIPAPTAKFKDVPEGHWAEASIDHMAGLGMVKGVNEAQDLFDMESTMTRASVATMFFRLSNGAEGIASTFEDVAADQWYTDAIGWAAKTGVVNGYSETAFGPDDTITRQQLAVMLQRYANLIGMDTKANANSLTAFTDGEQADDWAAEGLAWCVKNGIMKGRGGDVLDPTAPVTRAEAAAMFDRMIGMLQK